MAHYHLTLKSHSRSKNANAVALASYRSGEKLWDESLRLYKDCCKKNLGLILHTEIINSFEMSREQLWNAAEAAETRKNSVVAHEVAFALPFEIDTAAKIKLSRDVCKYLIKKYNCAVDLAVHAPDKENDENELNFHSAILITTRVIAADGLGKKWRNFNQPTGRYELIALRKEFEIMQNRALEIAGIDERISSERVQEAPKKYSRISCKKYKSLKQAGLLKEFKEEAGLEEAENWKRYCEEEIQQLELELQLANNT